MKYELIESPNNPGHWHVEEFDEEGECVKAVFSGPGAEQDAKNYAVFIQYLSDHRYDHVTPEICDEVLKSLRGLFNAK